MPDAETRVQSGDDSVQPLDNLINACRSYFRDHLTTEKDQRKRTVGQKRLDFVRFIKRKAKNKKHCLYYEHCVRGIKKFWPDIEGGGTETKLDGRKVNHAMSFGKKYVAQSTAMLSQMKEKGKTQANIHKSEERIIKYNDLDDAQRTATASAAFVLAESGEGDWYNAAGDLSTYLSELMKKISEYTNGQKDFKNPASELLIEKIQQEIKSKLQTF